MRALSFTLIGFGVLLFLIAGYDELRGSTSSPSAGSRYGGYYSHYAITREGNPGQFHNAMTYHWFYASLLTLAGVIAFLIDRGQEKSDPLSPDSDEQIDEELRQDERDEQAGNIKEPDQQQKP